MNKQTIKCDYCNCIVSYILYANFIVFCPECKKVIQFECEYGYGPVTPCTISLGEYIIATVTENKKNEYLLKIESDGQLFKLKESYLEALYEASNIMKDKLTPNIFKKDFGIQNSVVKELALETTNKISEYFNNKMADYSIISMNDEPYLTFSIQLQAYNYFKILLNYDKDKFECSIQVGENYFIPLDNSQKGKENANFDIFLKELQEEIELRIPDKFLRAKGWM